MIVFAVILLFLAAVAVGFGVMLFTNGARVRTRNQGVEGGGDRRSGAAGLFRSGEIFSVMGTSIRVFTSRNASHDERLKAGGAFCVLTGIVLVCLAVLAFIVAAI